VRYKKRKGNRTRTDQSARKASRHSIRGERLFQLLAKRKDEQIREGGAL